MNEILLRRSGLLLEVGDAHGGGTHPAAANVLANELQYQYKRYLRGAEAYDQISGRRSTMQLETRPLYILPPSGRYVTGFGFYKKVRDKLAGAGFRVLFRDDTPPSERQGAYVPDWDHLAQQMALIGIGFRAKQLECLQNLANATCGVIDAVTGFGKSEIIGMACALFWRAKIDIVLKSVSIARFLQRKLGRYLPAVGFVGDGDRSYSRVTIYTADSLHWSNGDCDFLFVDEGHALMTSTYAKVLGEKYLACKPFTFSATPDDRMDGASATLRYVFGDNIFTLKYPEAVALGLVVQIKVEWLLVESDVNPAEGKDETEAERWGIWKNDYRNRIIANHASTWPADTQVLILVAKLEHALHLKRFLPNFEICCGDVETKKMAAFQRSGLWPDGMLAMSSERRMAMATAFEHRQLMRVIATDVWATGVSFDSLQVVYRADARSSVIMSDQGPGRCSRISDGKEYGVLVDCVDKFDKRFMGKSRQRRTNYRRHQWDENWPRLVH